MLEEAVGRLERLPKTIYEADVKTLFAIGLIPFDSTGIVAYQNSRGGRGGYRGLGAEIRPRGNTNSTTLARA